MKFYFTLIILIMSISLFAQEQKDVLSKIREIDNSIRQGTIKSESQGYTNITTVADNKKINNKYHTIDTLVYTKDKSKRIRDYQGDYLYRTTEYYDGKDYYSISGEGILAFNNAFSDLLIGNTKTNSLKPAPSFSYGRGLSALSDLKYDLVKNEISGYNEYKNKLVAKVDPKYQYAAYEIKRYNSDNKLMAVYTNKKPVLTDGKYYIYSESTYKSAIVNRKQNVKIISATFKEPKKSEYTYDINQEYPRVFDHRLGGEINIVSFKAGEIPNGTTTDEILELSKKKLKRDTNLMKQAQRQFNTGGPKNQVLLIISLTTILLIIFVLIKNIMRIKREKHD